MLPHRLVAYGDAGEQSCSGRGGCSIHDHQFYWLLRSAVAYPPPKLLDKFNNIYNNSIFLYSALHDQCSALYKKKLYNQWLLLCLLIPCSGYKFIQNFCGLTITRLPISAPVVITLATRTFCAPFRHVAMSANVFAWKKNQPPRPRTGPASLSRALCRYVTLTHSIIKIPGRIGRLGLRVAVSRKCVLVLKIYGNPFQLFSIA